MRWTLLCPAGGGSSERRALIDGAGGDLPERHLERHRVGGRQVVRRPAGRGDPSSSVPAAAEPGRPIA